MWCPLEHKAKAAHPLYIMIKKAKTALICKIFQKRWWGKKQRSNKCLQYHLCKAFLYLFNL